jgi:hypothetical protein
VQARRTFPKNVLQFFSKLPQKHTRVDGYLEFSFGLLRTGKSRALAAAIDWAIASAVARERRHTAIKPRVVHPCSRHHCRTEGVRQGVAAVPQTEVPLDHLLGRRNVRCLLLVLF